MSSRKSSIESDTRLDEEPQRECSVNATGDWTCPEAECGNINFAKRTSCNRCGKERGECPKKKKLGHEIGKAAAEKSRGLFSADDWQCNKCGNVNWARRQQCNMCNAPKFSESEERTGYGGGYNDRGVVEYKERRNDDDDEYDEFGRRKKKRRIENRSDDDSKDSLKYSNSHNYKSNKKNKDSSDSENEDDEKLRKHKSDRDKETDKNDYNDEEEDEEDEDDDEDGDLSKYDLSEWDDLPVKDSSNGSAGVSEERESR